jgi:hypothetical protein
MMANISLVMTGAGAFALDRLLHKGPAVHTTGAMLPARG